MLGYYIFIIGATVLVGVVTLVDWLARRKDRQTRDRAAGLR